MRYRLTERQVLGDTLGLDDEIQLMRVTIQHLVTMLDQQAELHQKVALGSILREAIDQLSRVIERASRLPAKTSMDLTSVTAMLQAIEGSIADALPDGPAKHQLIMNVQSRIKGISSSEAPSAVILRTCDMMDRSVPFIESHSSNAE